MQRIKKYFEEALGGGKKAKIQDASNMALSYAGKALKEGATVKSSFADFFDEESKRPSRSEKLVMQQVKQQFKHI